MRLAIVILLLMSVQPRPYDYYTVMRIVVCILFAMLGADEFKSKRALLCAFCWVCALLFQPIKKIEITRHAWISIDQILAVTLILWIVIDVFVKIKNRKGLLSK